MVAGGFGAQEKCLPQFPQVALMNGMAIAEANWNWIRFLPTEGRAAQVI
jgi:hypothetical protein